MKAPIEILEILRDFYYVSGFRVSIHDVDCREIYAYPAAVSPFCAAIQQDKRVLNDCLKNDATMLQKVRESGETLFYRCPQGLYEAAAPIYHYGVLSGFLMIGQVRATGDEALQQIFKNAQTILGDNEQAQRITAKIPEMTEGRMHAYLSIMTVIAEYLTETNRVQSDSGKLAELIAQYIHRHYTENISLQSLSKKFGFCNATLTKSFRREYNCTIFSYLQQVRLQAACDLLTGSDKSVKEVAASCGFRDQNYFSRVFRQVYAYAPSDYRSR